MRVKLFVAPPFNNQSYIRLLDSEQKDATATHGVLYKKLPPDFNIDCFERVQTIAESDFVIVPQGLRAKKPAWEVYFQGVLSLARAADKQVIVFIARDDGHKTHIEDAIVFKGSDYKSAMWSNEIILAPFTEDIAEGRELAWRHKGAKPTVSFCGYAGFPDLKTRLKYHLKNSALDILSLVTQSPRWRVYKRGIYFRRSAISMLRDNSRVASNFIIRDTFSGNVRMTRIDPGQARREYIGNMVDSDFVLAPKGDGNYSIRFYEALSLGRIPILIDTDMMLPLENQIDYSKFIVRVPHTDVHKLGDIIADLYDSLTDEQFVGMQQAARDAFMRFLRYDSFFNFALPQLKEKGVNGLR